MEHNTFYSKLDTVHELKRGSVTCSSVSALTDWHVVSEKCQVFLFSSAGVLLKSFSERFCCCNVGVKRGTFVFVSASLLCELALTVKHFNPLTGMDHS